jgi:hypothetical protein
MLTAPSLMRIAYQHTYGMAVAISLTHGTSLLLRRRGGMSQRGELTAERIHR